MAATAAAANATQYSVGGFQTLARSAVDRPVSAGPVGSVEAAADAEQN